MLWQRILIHGSFLLFLGCAVGYLRYLHRGTEKARKIGMTNFLLAAGCAVGVLVLRLEASTGGGVLPIGVCEILLLLAVSMALFTLLGVAFLRIGMLPLAASPLAALCSIIAAFHLRNAPVLRDDLAGGLPALHMVAGLAAYSALLLLLAVSAIYLGVEKELKRKQLRPMIDRAPSLGDLSRAQTFFLSLGFALLTALIVSGIVQIHFAETKPSGLDPKVLAALVTWMVYGALLAARLLSRLRGHRLAVVTVWASLLIVLTFVSESAWPGWHDFLGSRHETEESETPESR